MATPNLERNGDLAMMERTTIDHLNYIQQAYYLVSGFTSGKEHNVYLHSRLVNICRE